MANKTKPWRSREWLWEHYVDKRLTQPETAAVAGCSKECIHKWLKRHNITAQMREPISPNQERTDAILEYIVSYKIEHDGNSPTMREIASGCGIPATSLILFYLRALERQGLIKLLGQSRARQICVTGGRWILEHEV